jgi:hypothetical protein
MPLDPNIALQVGQPVQPIDPLKAYGQVLTLKNLMDQQRMQSMQMERAQREESDARGLRSAYAVTPDGQIDEQATTQNLVRGGFGPQAVDFRHKMQTDRSAAAKAEREAEKARLETLGKTIDLTGQVLSALGPNPTHGQAMDAALFLNQQGIKVDLNSIPEDPAKLAQFVQQHAWQTMSAKEQIAERRAAMEPKSEPGRIEADYRRGLLPNGGGGVTSSVGTTLANNPNATLNAPTAQFQAGAGNELYDAAMARAAYGQPPEGFRYVGRTQQLEPIPEVLAEKLKRAEASATRVSNIMPEVEKNARIVGNKDFIDNEYRPTMKLAETASRMNSQADAIERLNLTTGPGASTKAMFANVLTGMGLAPEKVERFASDSQAFKAFMMQNNWELLNQAKGPQTEGDAQRAQETWLRLENSPNANKYIADFMRAANARVKAKADFYRKNYGAAQDSGDLGKMERDWLASPDADKSIFDDPRMKKWTKPEAAGARVRQYNPATGKIE